MNTKKLGFSLIELVVAITIGGVVLATVMGSFLTLSKMRQQLDLTRQIQREINFAVIRMADRVRSQSIAYPFVDSDKHILKIIGGDSFTFDSTSGELTMEDFSGNTAPLFSSNLQVQQLKFTILPITELETKIMQPSVKIELEVSEKTEETNPKSSVRIRTTISSRLIK